MGDFETLEKRECEFRQKNFFELSMKVLRDKDSSTKLLAMTRGTGTLKALPQRKVK